MSFVMLAPVLFSLKSCFLWSFVTVFFYITIKDFFCIGVTIQGNAVCDLFPWSRFSGDLCNQSVSVVLLNFHSSATQPGRLSWVLVFLFFFCPHFEGLAFFILLSHPKMVRKVGVDNLNGARMDFMLYILYSYTMLSWPPKKIPKCLDSVDKIYNFISPWIPKGIRISSLIVFIAFSPSHRDQVHIYQTCSKSSVLLCCFAISSIYDRTLRLVWLFVQIFLSLKVFLFWILLITAIIVQVSVQSPSLMRGVHHQ